MNKMKTEELIKNYTGKRIVGGMADKLTPAEIFEKFDMKQIEMGLKVEQEHTTDLNIALEITMDHLVEIPRYYSYLKLMEAIAKSI